MYLKKTPLRGVFFVFGEAFWCRLGGWPRIRGVGTPMPG